ncbi:MAG TPA: hypothetical protein VF292_02610 [Rhodanobacteraceae bacterium]
MNDRADNIVLEMLKGLRNDVATLRSEMHDQFGDLKQRMLAIERGMGGMKRDTAEVYEDHARQQASIDKLTARVERIERRLELGP